MDSIKTGRPALSVKEVDNIFRKLDPYLRAGLSIHKACLKAKIPKSTVYDLRNENDDFSEKLELSQNHQSILVSNIINNELEMIQVKQKGEKGLNRGQLKFVQWVATNSRTTKTEFTRDEIEEEEDKTMKMIKKDPRVAVTLMKTYEAMMRNMGVKITHEPLAK